MAETTDQFAELVARMGRWIALVGVISWVVVVAIWGWKNGAGFGFGVIAAYLNMRWLANGLARPEGSGAGLFVLRLALVGGAAYVILETFAIGPLFVLAGLLSASLAAVLEILFQLFYART